MDERGDGVTSLERVPVTSKRLQNLEPNVSCANSDVLSIADAKIDVPDLGAIGNQDTKMIIRNEAASRLTRHNSVESECDPATRQSFGRKWKRLFW
jgi:hypothetical protein